MGIVLIGNSDIIGLHEKGFNGVTEQDIKNILQRYTLGQSLFFIGITSKMLFDILSGERKDSGYEILGLGAIRNPATTVITSDFALAYLANMLLISGSNDWKAKSLVEQNKGNLEILIAIYNNCVVSHKIVEGERTPEERDANARSILIRLFQEQLSMQFLFADLISRNYYLFCKIAKENTTSRYLYDTFAEVNGISMEDYFYIGLGIFALISVKNPLFTIGQLTQATDVANHVALSQENVDAFMKMRSTDYAGFRETDALKNPNPSEWYTKTRFNPLNQYPIIKMQRSIDNKEYVIPSHPLYVKSTFDLFWTFDDYFSSISRTAQSDFRSTFGQILEEYVGVILKHIYGEDNVHGEITYTTRDGEIKFLDYYVEVGEKVYIFEVKANRFRLPTLQVGLESELIDEEITKFTKPILQVKKRFGEINTYDELAFFRGKELVPIVIFADIPFVNDPNFYEQILAKTEKGQEALQAITDLNINCCNLLDIEKYAERSDAVSLEEVFTEMKANPKGTSVMSICGRYPKNERTDFLDGEFQSFCATVLKTAQNDLNV